MSEFGKIMRERRKQLGYTQQDVADICGVSRPFIALVEVNRSAVTLEKALKISRILDFSLDDLKVSVELVDVVPSSEQRKRRKIERLKKQLAELDQ